MNELEEILQHKFKNPGLLQKALTHSSHDVHIDGNYERLEFLGDRVLGLSIAALLYKIFPKEPEGNLSQRHTALVCKDTVAMVAKSLSLDKFIIAGADDIRENESVLCDVCEAVIGAIYIDSGCDEAISFVNKHWRELIDKNMAPPKDNKTTLQEVAHIKGYGVPRYKVVNREGSEHEPIFFVEVSLEKVQPQVGRGHSKKMAEFDAAGKMLEIISK